MPFCKQKRKRIMIVGIKNLMEALAREMIPGTLTTLPHTKPTLIKYEKEGIIPIPERIEYGNKKHRIYTPELIKISVEKIKKYWAKKKK